MKKRRVQALLLSIVLGFSVMSMPSASVSAATADMTAALEISGEPKGMDSGNTEDYDEENTDEKTGEEPAGGTINDTDENGKHAVSEETVNDTGNNQAKDETQEHEETSDDSEKEPKEEELTENDEGLSADPDSQSEETNAVSDEKTEKSEEDISLESTTTKGAVSPASDFEYTTANNQITIKKYKGAGGDVVIPDAIGDIPITAIASNAFKDNDNITSVTLSAGLLSIGEYAFFECSKIKSINFNEGLKTTAKYSFGYCSSLEEIILPNTLEELGDQVFAHCTSVTKVYIPKSINDVDLGPFTSCTSLRTVEFEEGIERIPGCKASYFYGKKGIFGESGIEEIVIPDSVTTIGGNAFYKCKSLKKVTFGSGLKTIEGGAFRDCTALEKAILPHGLTTLGDQSFDGCTSLSEVFLPNTLTGRSPAAFCDTTALKKLTFEEGTTKIYGGNPVYDKEGMFKNCGIEEVVIPESVTEIDDCAFGNCHELKRITLTDNITSIGQRAFYNCESLLTIDLPDDITNIRHQTFFGCSKLDNVVIPSQVTNIGKGAFQGCSSLQSVYYPKSVTTVDDDAYRDCTSLKNVEFETHNQYTSEQKLGENIFMGCTSLDNVQLGNRITAIPKAAFSGCTSLYEIQIPHGVKSIPSGAFAKCNKLEIMFVPASVTTFGTTDTEFERSYNHVPLVYVEKGDATTAGVSAKAMGWDVETGIWNIDYSDSAHNEFPDKNFNNELYEKNVDINIDTRLTLREIEALTTLDISGKQIESIKGLELLTSIEELDISENSIDTLFVTEIAPTDTADAYFVTKKLKNLKKFDLSDNRIPFLDMSQNAALTDINCENNEILALDLSDNKNLKNLEVGEQLRTCEITKTNYFDNLLDIETEYGKQYKKEAVQDITDDYILKGEEGEAVKEGITFEKAYYVPDVLYYEYKVGFGAGSTKTMSVTVPLTNAGLPVTDPELSKAYPDANFKAALFARLDENENNLLSKTEERRAKKLDISGREIADVTGIDRLWNLEKLTASHNDMKALDLSKNTKLQYLQCDNNKIKTLDLKSLADLKELYAGENNLAAIDVSGLKKLDTLRLGNQTITLTGDIDGTTRNIDMTAYDAAFDKMALSSAKAFDSEGKETETGAVITETGFEVSYEAVFLEYVWTTSKGNMNVKATISNEGDPDIKQPVYVSSVSLDVYSLTLKEGKSYTLKATVTPEDADITDVTFSSSDTEVIAIEGAMITALKSGTAIVTAAADGAKKGETVSASCIVTVKASEVEPEDQQEKPSERGFWIAGLNSGYTYTANAIIPAFRLYYDDTLLRSGTDYSVVYKNNKSVKASTTDSSKLLNSASALLDKKDPYVQITLKGNYKGTLIKTFSIDKKPLGDNDITVVNATAVYTGKAQKLQPRLYWNGKEISSREYEITGDDWNAGGYKEVGVYNVTIKGRDSSFTGSADAVIIIKEEDSGILNLSKLKFISTAQKADLIYDGTEKEPQYIIKNGNADAGLALSADGENGDYRIVYENNVNVGTATARFIALPGSLKCVGTKSMTFKITKPAPTDLSKAEDKLKVSLVDDNGTEIEETVFSKGGVKPKVKVTLIVDDDKTVELSENTDYKISYKNNKAAAAKTSAKAPLIVINGKGDYKGKAEIPFTIKAQDLKNLDLVVDDIVLGAKDKQKPYAYQKTSFTLTDTDGTVLKMGTDYKSVKKGVKESHTDNIFKADDVTLSEGSVVTLTLYANGGNYTGKISASYRVISAEKSLKKAIVTIKDSAVKKLVYEDGNPVKLDESDLIVRLSKNSEPLPADCYEIISFTGNTSAGNKAKLTIRGKNGYGNMKTINVTIRPAGNE